MKVTKLEQIFETVVGFMRWYYDTQGTQNNISKIIESSERIIKENKKFEYFIRASMLALHCRKHGFMVPMVWDELATANYIYILNCDYKEAADSIIAIQSLSEKEWTETFDIETETRELHIQENIQYYYSNIMMFAEVQLGRIIENPMNIEDFKSYIDRKLLSAIDRKTLLIALATFLLVTDDSLKNRTVVFNQVIEILSNGENIKKNQRKSENLGTKNEEKAQKKHAKWLKNDKDLTNLFNVLEEKGYIEIINKNQFAKSLYEIIEIQGNLGTLQNSIRKPIYNLYFDKIMTSNRKEKMQAKAQK